ncbi:hypothetical protein HZS_6029 [Henneguya salminicola]|nr:hypothetical protein HZS_6029 [Henneguya salminicola]
MSSFRSYKRITRYENTISVFLFLTFLLKFFHSVRVTFILGINAGIIEKLMSWITTSGKKLCLLIL